jgi:limonene-1,2-epoxide hydrolase
MDDKHLTRRTVFAAAGAVALAGLAKPAVAATPATAEEKANLKLLKEFIVAWTAPDFVPAKTIKASMTDDAKIRFNETAAPVDTAKLTSLWDEFIAKGQTGTVKILDIYAKGPLVVAHRRETEHTPGKPDHTFEVVGVFFFKNGKIKTWDDYVTA